MFWQSSTVQPPFDAAAIAASHSALTAVLAGFALAALFLMIERLPRDSTDRVQANKYQMRATFLMFIAFLTGTLASYLYSSNSVDTPVRAYYLYLFPSTIFGMHAVLLMGGITNLFGTFQLPEVLRLTRRVSYMVVLFSTVIIYKGIWESMETFQVARWVFTVVLVCGLLAFLFTVICLLPFKMSRRVRGWINGHTFRQFSYFSTFAAFGIAVPYSLQNAIADRDVTLLPFVPIFLILLATVTSVWAILLMPFDEDAAAGSRSNRSKRTRGFLQGQEL